MHVTKTAMVVDAGFVIFFIVAIVKREVRSSENHPTLKTIKQVGEELDTIQIGCINLSITIKIQE